MTARGLAAPSMLTLSRLTLSLLALWPALCGCEALLDLDGTAMDCAKAPAPKLPAALVKACTLKVSCSPFPAFRIGECIADARPHASAGDRCYRDAKSCVDITKCNGYAMLGAAACDGRVKGWSCAGSQAIRCGFGAPYYVDCAFHGGECKLYANAAKSSIWPCTMPYTSACKVNDQWHCEGDVMVTCSNGTRWGRDCAARGLRCVQTKTNAYCSSFTEPCLVDACVDGKAVNCGSNQLGHIYDCALAGGHCDAGKCQPLQPSGCVHLRTKEAPVKCQERCLDKTRMQVCLYAQQKAVYTIAQGWFDRGRPHIIDCLDHGFARCAAATASDDVPFTWCK